MFTVEDLYGCLKYLDEKYKDSALLELSIMDGQFMLSVFDLPPKENKTYYRTMMSFEELFQSKADPLHILDYKIQFSLKALESINETVSNT